MTEKKLRSICFISILYLNGNAEWCTHNENLYFKRCITYGPVSSTGFRARIVPPGVITLNAAYGIFAEDKILSPLYAYLMSHSRQVPYKDPLLNDQSQQG